MTAKNLQFNRIETRKFIKGWANRETSPHFAVLIQGEWGCGKTHFVQSFINDSDFTDRKVIYISLFGLSTVEALQTQLFYSSATTGIKWLHQGAGIAGSMLKGVMKLDVTGDGNSDTTIEGKFSGITNIIQQVGEQIDNSLLILDDLERSGIPMADLLGVVNKFVEHGDTRVILIANQDKISDTDFNGFYEKVVGQSFMLMSDPEDALKSFLDEISNNEAKEAIEIQIEYICDLYKTSGFQNLRALRQFIWHLEGIINKLNQEYRNNNDLIKSLIFQAFIFFMEFKLDLSDDSKLVNIRDLLNERNVNIDDIRYVYDLSYFSEKEQTPKSKVFSKYGADNGIYTVISVRQWISILETGVVDESRINSEIASAKEVTKGAETPSWRRLWFFLNCENDKSSHHQFEIDLKDVNQKIVKGQYFHPGVFLHVSALLIEFSANGILSVGVEDRIKLLKKYIDDELIPNMTYESYRSARSSDVTAYDGLGFWNHEGKEFIEIYNYLISMANDWYEQWKKDQAPLELLSYMKSDFKRFQENLILVEDSTEQRFHREAILNNIKSAEFVDSWMKLRRENELRVIGILKERYRYYPEVFSSEFHWLEEVKVELAKFKNKEANKLRRVQIGSLLIQLESILEK